MTLPVLIYTHGIVTFDLPGAAVIATVQWRCRSLCTAATDSCSPD